MYDLGGAPFLFKFLKVAFVFYTMLAVLGIMYHDQPESLVIVAGLTVIVTVLLLLALI